MAKTSKKTIKVVYNNNDQLAIKEVEAEKFDEVIIDNKIIKLYIHRSISNNKRWTITEEATGRLLKDNFKNKIEARNQYEKDLKDRLIALIKNNYNIYLKAIKNFNNYTEYLSKVNYVLIQLESIIIDYNKGE